MLLPRRRSDSRWPPPSQNNLSKQYLVLKKKKMVPAHSPVLSPLYANFYCRLRGSIKTPIGAPSTRPALRAQRMAYARAPGQPPCRYGCACNRQNPQHWTVYDHPAEHERITTRQAGAKRKQPEVIDLDDEPEDGPEVRKLIGMGFASLSGAQCRIGLRWRGPALKVVARTAMRRLPRRSLRRPAASLLRPTTLPWPDACRRRSRRTPRTHQSTPEHTRAHRAAAALRGGHNGPRTTDGAPS